MRNKTMQTQSIEIVWCIFNKNQLNSIKKQSYDKLAYKGETFQV